MSETALTIVINTVGIIILLTFHEWGHAKAARLLGDPTAEDNGRLTLNPAAHIDPIGTVILPVIMQLGGGGFFGWAKPVPVDPRMLKNPKRDMMLIAAAGPLMNIILAFVIFLASTALFGKINIEIWRLVRLAGVVSVVLAMFNLIPVHPLDGYSVVYGLLPPRYAIQFAQSMQYGFIMLIGMLFVLPMVGVDVFAWVLWPAVSFVSGILESVARAIV